jgi:hypothetical protein
MNLISKKPAHACSANAGCSTRHYRISFSNHHSPLIFSLLKSALVEVRREIGKFVATSFHDVDAIEM